MTNDSLGDRMKGYYEDRNSQKLIRNIPVIIRLDGKAFHTFTRKFCKEVFDTDMSKAMSMTSLHLLGNIQGAKFTYTQSDEISIFLTDYDTVKTDAWFDYKIQKICSVAASMASIVFNEHFFNNKQRPSISELGLFDARCFNIPKEDVMNYFIWRQRDAIRNSLNTYAQKFFSAKQLHGKKTADKHEMLHSIGKNWATDLKEHEKNGLFRYIFYGATEDDDPLPVDAGVINYHSEPYNSLIYDPSNQDTASEVLLTAIHEYYSEQKSIDKAVKMLNNASPSDINNYTTLLQKENV